MYSLYRMDRRLLSCVYMAARFVVPTVSVAKVRDSLPSYLEAARRHLLQIVTRHERDAVAFLALEDLQELLGSNHFETAVALHEGEATVSLPQFSIIGIGEDHDTALDDAAGKLREYALQYQQRFEFYKHTDRRKLYPLVMRFLATPEDQQRDLLLEPEETEAVTVLA